jgi:hypothetical protein
MRFSGSEGSRPRSEDIAWGEYVGKESELDAGDGEEQDMETVIGREAANLKTRSGPTIFRSRGTSQATLIIDELDILEVADSRE